MSLDIVRSVTIAAPRERVWRAISDPRRFGVWFGARLEGAFVVGQWCEGSIEPTRADPAVAVLQEPARGLPLRILVETIEPPSRFAFRWHPFAIDPGRDYSAEPTTLVTFALEEAEGGTRLTITETGFEALPETRAAEARERNGEGWTHQARLVAAYLERGMDRT